MKVSDIKTMDQFWMFADVWYKRAANLSVIWNDENETEERKLKAFYLWGKYKSRVLDLFLISQRINKSLHSSYPKGGITQN